MKGKMFLLHFAAAIHFITTNVGANSIFHDPFGEVLGGGSGNNEPEFVEAIKNVTVPAGREAVLSCIVRSLAKFKVGWIRAEDQTILTLDGKVVTHNSRVTVTHDGAQTWNLHIRQVRQSDRGCYMCQINTAIMRKQLGCIDVHVSPNILDEETSSDLTVREGDNATLLCRASGHPTPTIIWKREDGEKISLRRGFRDVYKGFDNITGSSLPFIKIDRRQSGVHLCIASNQVSPSVSKRINLDVNCCPKVFSYWMKNRGEMLIDGLGLKNSTKYSIEETRHSYKVYMKITIRNFGKKDVGIYNCVATNSLGKAEDSIRLHEIKTTKGTSSATENQVVTLPGFATPAVSTETRNTGHHQQNKNSESMWTYAVAPRDSLDSPRHHDPSSDVRRDGDSAPASSSCGSLFHKISMNSVLALFFIIPKSGIIFIILLSTLGSSVR